MPRRAFKPTDWLHLTELAHAALLSGLVAARRWSADELKFQGGTSLHLIYGSPRFSEDLDFVTATPKGLHAAMRGACAHVKAAFIREFPQLRVTIKVRDEEGEQNPRNPRLFTLTLSEPDWHEPLKIKVEFFVVADQVARSYASHQRPMAALRPRLQVDIPPVELEVALLEEILCDKLHALGDRSRIKERDVFDLWWICQQQGLNVADAATQFSVRHENHLAMYPNGKALPELAASLRERAGQLQATLGQPAAVKRMVDAITRWMPTPGARPSPLASEVSIRAMMEHAAGCALATAAVVEALLRDRALP